jgi:hypothetical protein
MVIATGLRIMAGANSVRSEQGAEDERPGAKHVGDGIPHGAGDEVEPEGPDRRPGANHQLIQQTEEQGRDSHCGQDQEPLEDPVAPRFREEGRRGLGVRKVWALLRWSRHSGPNLPSKGGGTVTEL